MKYIILESQYYKLISKITGKRDESFIDKIKNFLSLNKDRSIGLMILQSVEEGNYELDNINRGSAKFVINNFPIEVYRMDGYHLYLPMVSEEPLKVSETISKQIFYTIAEKHMDRIGYLKICADDSMDEIY